MKLKWIQVVRSRYRGSLAKQIRHLRKVAPHRVNSKGQPLWMNRGQDTFPVASMKDGHLKVVLAGMRRNNRVGVLEYRQWKPILQANNKPTAAVEVKQDVWVDIIIDELKHRRIPLAGELVGPWKYLLGDHLGGES